MKLRLISIALTAGLLSGCGGLGFMNLAVAPAVATPVVAGVDIASHPEMGPRLVGYVVPIVGNYDSYNEVFSGRVTRDLSDDSEVVALVLNNTGVACEGRLYPPDDGWPTEFPLAMRNCLNRLVRGTLTCSDGRELELDWRATQCRTAYGAGFDRDGGTVQFMVLDDGVRAAEKADMLITQLEPFPPLPLPTAR
jgi:hypothetical protein